MRPLLLLVLTLLCADSARAVVLVRFETVLGDFDVELYDDRAPLTVSNFLAYTRDGDYDGSFIHRSIPGFIVQGGSFGFDGTLFYAIPQRPPVMNEFQPCDGGCTVRGTLAMAKIMDQPDSATNSWFVNLANNSANLDNQNEGFAVFGRVIGDGMDVVDAIAALPTTTVDLPGVLPVLQNFPLYNYTGGAITAANLAMVPRIVEVSEPGASALRAGALGCVFFVARLTARRRGAGRRP